MKTTTVTKFLQDNGFPHSDLKLYVWTNGMDKPIAILEPHAILNYDNHTSLVVRLPEDHTIAHNKNVLEVEPGPFAREISILDESIEMIEGKEDSKAAVEFLQGLRNHYAMGNDIAKVYENYPDLNPNATQEERAEMLKLK